MSYLGIDVGTSGCKAGRFDARGSLLALAYHEYPLITPQAGWAEIDSAAVCRSCLDAIREAAAASPADPVAALAISSQGEAFTPVSADGAYLANAMVSFDVRSEPSVAEFTRRFAAGRLYELTGHTPHTMFTLFKLLWLCRHRPDVWRAAVKFYSFRRVAPAATGPRTGHQLAVGRPNHALQRADPSVGGRGPFRDPHGSLPIGAPGGVGHGGRHNQPERCGRTGLATGSDGRGRGARSALRRSRAGIVEPGTAMYSTGTTECICPLFPRPVFHEDLFRSNLCTYDSAIPGTYTTVAFSLTGGNLLRWFRDQWCEAEVQDAARKGDDPYEVILRGMDDEPTDLFVLPYFTTSGTPYCDPQVPGAILGLRLGTTRGQVLRAAAGGSGLGDATECGTAGSRRPGGPRISRDRRGSEERRLDATQGGRARPPRDDAGGDRGRLPGRGDVGLRRPHRVADPPVGRRLGEDDQDR